MRASDFLQKHARSSLRAWEAAVVELARKGDVVPVRWADVPLQAGPRAGVVRVSEDVFSIGEPGDWVRMPLTAAAAQAVANVTGSLLPTKKLAMEINRYVRARTTPITPFSANPGANLPSFFRHSQLVDGQLASLGNPSGIVGGHKKDLVVSNRTRPGYESIYGWYGTVPGVPPQVDAYGQKFVQPLSDVHDGNYVDYSHGVRLIAPTMLVDGRGEVSTEEVYKDPSLSPLVSDEGPIKNPRYDARAFGEGPADSDLISRAWGLTRIYLEGLRAAYVFSAWKRTS